MKKTKIILLIAVAALYLFPGIGLADGATGDFDFLLGVTRPAHEMDWWFAVPERFVPKLTGTSEVTKGEYFKIIPIFKNYGISPKNEVHITYDLEIIKSDGTVDESQKNVNGFKGQNPGPFLMPAMGISIARFISSKEFSNKKIALNSDPLHQIRLQPVSGFTNEYRGALQTITD